MCKDRTASLPSGFFDSATAVTGPPSANAAGPLRHALHRCRRPRDPGIADAG
jgi:hypothetical protein